MALPVLPEEGKVSNKKESEMKVSNVTKDNFIFDNIDKDDVNVERFISIKKMQYNQIVETLIEFYKSTGCNEKLIVMESAHIRRVGLKTLDETIINELLTYVSLDKVNQIVNTTLTYCLCHDIHKPIDADTHYLMGITTANKFIDYIKDCKRELSVFLREIDKEYLNKAISSHGDKSDSPYKIDLESMKVLLEDMSPDAVFLISFNMLVDSDFIDKFLISKVFRKFKFKKTATQRYISAKKILEIHEEFKYSLNANYAIADERSVMYKQLLELFKEEI